MRLAGARDAADKTYVNRGAIWGEGAVYTLAPLYLPVSYWPALKFTMRQGDGLMRKN